MVRMVVVAVIGSLVGELHLNGFQRPVLAHNDVGLRA